MPEPAQIEKPPELTEQPQNKKFSTLFVFFIAVFFLSLGLAIAFVYYQYTQPKQTQPTPSPTATLPLPSPTQTEPSIPDNWETYRSTIYKYEIRYPSDWFLLAPTEGVSETTLLTEIREKYDVYPLHNLSIHSYPGDSKEQLQWFKKSTENWVWEGEPKTAELEIDGTKSWMIEGVMKWPTDETEYWIKYVLIPGPGVLYQLNWRDDQMKSGEDIYKQMLSTFKFLGQDIDSEIISLVSQYRKRIIRDSGTAAIDIEVNKPALFSDGIYNVTFNFLDKDGNKLPTEPGYVLVGKLDGQWTVSFPYDENFCRWLMEANVDESAKIFMGLQNCK